MSVSSGSVRFKFKDSISIRRSTTRKSSTKKDSSSSSRLYIYIKSHWLLPIIRSSCQPAASLE